MFDTEVELVPLNLFSVIFESIELFSLCLYLLLFCSRFRLRKDLNRISLICSVSLDNNNHCWLSKMSSAVKKYEGSDDYIASEELANIVNASIALGRPLLVRGEPGTGKTLLAISIAKSLNKRLIVWNIKSTSKAKDGLYVYDTVQRLNDSRFEDKDISNIENYIRLGELGQAFDTDEQVVLLIDEIDKADIESIYLV